MTKADIKEKGEEFQELLMAQKNVRELESKIEALKMEEKKKVRELEAKIEALKKVHELETQELEAQLKVARIKEYQAYIKIKKYFKSDPKATGTK